MMKKSIKASLIAVAITSLSTVSQAAGLGQINVMSGLGQPLKAEIQVSASTQELQSLIARIASADAFRQANIPYATSVASVRINLDNRGPRPVLKLSSDKPINDPVVNLLIELDWASGRLAREYVFLLDPVDLEIARPKAAQAEASAIVTAPRSAPTTAAAPRAEKAPATATASAATATDGAYTTQRGDTLRRIADANRPEGVTLDQALIALYRENPAAFNNKNINRLRAGAIIKMPSAETMKSVDTAEARREVIAHSSDFQNYRRSLAESAAKQSPSAETATPTDQGSSGRIVPRVEETQQAGGSKDQVQVSRSETGSGKKKGASGNKDAENRIRTLEEDVVAREKALAEANSRVADLERNVNDLKKLLELKSQGMGQAQQQAATPPAPPPVQGTQPTPAAQDVKPPPPAVVEPPVEPPKQTTQATTEPVAPPPVAETPPPPAPPEPPPKKKPAPPPPPPEPEPGFLDFLDAKMLAGIGGILALLLGYVGYRSWQRRKASGSTNENSALISEFPPESSGVFGTTGGQSVDTNSTNSSIIHTDFSQSGLSAIDADEGVDPVAEADVYMAYGRDAQAEEILLDALKADPSRAAIHLKLLEIYAQRKNTKQFEAVASEFYARTGGVGADWEKAAAMGQKFDPENPLYGSRKNQESAPRIEQGPMTAGVGTVAAAMAAAAAKNDAPSSPKSGPVEKDPAGQSLSDLNFTTSAPVIEVSNSQLKDTWAMPGSLPSDPEQYENVVQAAAMGTTTQTPAGGDGLSLDFDLDLDDAPTAEPVKAAPPPKPAAPPIEADVRSSDLVLDLDIGGDDGVAEAVAPAPVAPSKPAAPQSGRGEVVDSSRGGGGGGGTIAVLGSEMSPAGAADNGLTFDLPEFATSQSADLDDFDMSATVVDSDIGVGRPHTSDTVIDLERSNLDGSLLDFGSDHDTDASPISAPSRDRSASTDMGEADGDSNEVDTKLELARAYEEMGDTEGARELLDEVLREGSPKQQADARAMIDRLG